MVYLNCKLAMCVNDCLQAVGSSRERVCPLERVLCLSPRVYVECQGKKGNLREPVVHRPRTLWVELYFHVFASFVIYVF